MLLVLQQVNPSPVSIHCRYTEIANMKKTKSQFEQEALERSKGSKPNVFQLIKPIF